MEQEIIRNQVYVKKIDDNISIELKGYHADDFYATNLNLTGCTNWFGSLNMSNLLGELSSDLFGIENVTNNTGIERTTESTTTSIDNIPSKPFNLLELGSGLGRAGIIAAKLMQLESCYGTCVLTDGEEDIVKQLELTCIHNQLPITSNTTETNIIPTPNSGSSGNSNGTGIEYHCQQLWWGASDELDLLKSKYPDGFDVIIGKKHMSTVYSWKCK